MSASPPYDSAVLAGITARVAAAGLLPPSSVVLEDCARYVDLLRRWNRRINLTALPLDSPIPDASLDKLIVEPLLAAPLVLSSERTWVDLGSGGGSPAIPLRLALGPSRLTMVEARGRKCAFLREAIRALSLSDAVVLESRFEALHSIPSSSIDFVTLRAVRVDDAILVLLGRLLRSGGRVFMFGASDYPAKSFTVTSEVRLPDGSSLQVLQRV